MNINGVALVFPEPRKTELREFTITSVESDEAIVRVEFSGVSIGTERGLFHGDDKRAVFPAVAGYQCVGVVAHLQKPTSRVKIGERVLVGPLGRVPGFNKCWGAHTSHTIAKIGDLIHCPLEVSPETAALSWLAGVGLQGVRKAGVKKGDSTVIIGQGMIGQMLAQMCRVAGASRIIASDMIPARVETSRRYSSDLCIDATKGNVRETIMSETGGGADVVFEATGRADMLASCLEYVKLDGMICNTGLYPGNVSFPFKTAHEKQIRMVFPFGWGDAEGDASVFADTLRLIGEGRITIQPLITHHIAYRDAPQEYLKIVSEGSSEAIGMIIDWKDQQSMLACIMDTGGDRLRAGTKGGMRAGSISAGRRIQMILSWDERKDRSIHGWQWGRVQFREASPKRGGAFSVLIRCSMIFRTYRGSVITAMMRIVDGWFIVTAPRGFLEKPAGMHTELSTLKPELSLLQMALCGVVELLNLEKHR